MPNQAIYSLSFLYDPSISHEEISSNFTPATYNDYTYTISLTHFSSFERLLEIYAHQNARKRDARVSRSKSVTMNQRANRVVKPRVQTVTRVQGRV